MKQENKSKNAAKYLEGAGDHKRPLEPSEHVRPKVPSSAASKVKASTLVNKEINR